MNPALLGFLRGLAVVVLATVVHYFTDAANLNGVVGESIAPLIAMIALAVEHSIAQNTGNALFGAVKA